MRERERERERDGEGGGGGTERAKERDGAKGEAQGIEQEEGYSCLASRPDLSSPGYPIPVSTSLNSPLSAPPHLRAFPQLSLPSLWCRFHPRPPWHNHPPIQPTDQPYHTVTPRPTDQYLPTTKLLPDYHSIRPL